MQDIREQKRLETERAMGAEELLPTEPGPETEPTAAPVKAITPERLREWDKLLKQYKSGKASIDRRTIDAEKWWKMRNQFMGEQATGKEKEGFRAKSAWLHNVISNKHANAMEALPEANILPREQGDKEMAWALSKILPVIHEQNDFGQTYSLIQWAKLKTGTGIYKVSWDRDKLNGLGDISIRKINVLDLFWEPGVEDIRQSKMVFHVELRDEDELKEAFPELQGKQLSQGFIPSKNPDDDYRPMDGKVYVIEAYYHKYVQGRKLLHYCQYVGDNVLYASEDVPELAERGYYDHGEFPFVFDSLYPVEGSPCGYGFVDICHNAQVRIDLMDTAFLKNTMVGATPRYFRRIDSNVNAEQFLDLETTLIEVTGNVGEDALRQVGNVSLDGNHIAVRNNTIDEMRETSGNTEAASGVSNSGVTAASAIAAMQEAAGKGSRDATAGSYRAFSRVVELEIELIRQFYELPRQFRILGSMGQQYFIPFDNAGMQPQHQGMIGDIDLGIHKPIYDVKVVPQKQNVYTKMSQNELALQLYNMGFFAPQAADPALMCLDIMDFDGKEELMQKISRNGTLYQLYMQLHQLTVSLAEQVDPAMAEGLMASAMGGGLGQLPTMGAGQKPELDTQQEPTHMEKARERARTASQPEG